MPSTRHLHTIYPLSLALSVSLPLPCKICNGKGLADVRRLTDLHMSHCVLKSCNLTKTKVDGRWQHAGILFRSQIIRSEIRSGHDGLDLEYWDCRVRVPRVAPCVHVHTHVCARDTRYMCQSASLVSWPVSAVHRSGILLLGRVYLWEKAQSTLQSRVMPSCQVSNVKWATWLHLECAGCAQSAQRDGLFFDHECCVAVAFRYR